MQIQGRARMITHSILIRISCHLNIRLKQQRELIPRAANPARRTLSKVEMSFSERW